MSGRSSAAFEETTARDDERRRSRDSSMKRPEPPGASLRMALRRSGPRLRTVIIVTTLILAAAVGGWWAGRVTLTSVAPIDGVQRSAIDTVWAEASKGSVGRSLAFSTTVRQPAVPVAQNALSGVVTSVSPGELDQGEIAYVVGDTPVRVVQGAKPFWRDLTTGAKGEDVATLQRLLIDEGHLRGSADGDFGAGTRAAVRGWQKAQGRPQTGSVSLGELIAVPTLPAVVQVGEGIVVGRRLAGGEDSVLAPTGDREFALTVSEEQARMIPAEATVEIKYESHTWVGVIASGSQDERGQTRFILAAADGGEVCGQDCSSLPSDAQVTLRSQVIVVPRVEGVAVPAAAVRTRADRTAYVVTDAGEVPVAVRGSGQGIAVVEGIQVGTRVQVLGQTDTESGLAPLEPTATSGG